jgi:hypothetical protein
MLNRSDKSRQPCLISDLNRIAFSLSPLSMMLSVRVFFKYICGHYHFEEVLILEVVFIIDVTMTWYPKETPEREKEGDLNSGCETSGLCHRKE